MPSKFLKVIAAKNDTEQNEILVHGPIGQSFWDDSGISGKDFTDALNQFPKGKKVTIGVNSQGGSVGEGLAIYNAIQRRGDDITVRIDGYAISIASVFPLAASKVISPKSSIWMIHNAWSYAGGNAKEMRKQADVLDTHDETLVGIYAERTGKPEKEIKAAMEAETWFSGQEAVDWGLADESEDKDVSDALNSFDFSKAPQGTFKNLPVAMGGAGFNKPNAITQPVASLDGQPKIKTMTEPTALAPVAPVAAAPENGDVKALKAQIVSINAQLETERKNRISLAIDQLVVENKLTVAEGKEWLPRAIKDETILDALKLREPAFAGASPVGHVSVGAGNGGRDVVMALPKGAKRYAHLKANWSDLQASGYRSTRGGVMAANTTDSALVTDMLLEGATTVLQNRLAPLRAFAKEVAIDRVKPLATLQHRKITAGGTAQTNPTNFEDTTNFVGTEDNVPITMAQITSGGHVTNAERQSGVAMAQWVDIKVAEISDKIMATVAAKILEGTFTITPEVSAAASFGDSELKSLWGKLKKSPIKNIILDGEYFAQFLPGDRFDFAETEYRNRGWDNFVMNTVWTGATANTVGFACNPQALVVGLGLPLRDANAGLVSTENILSLPELGVSVAVYQWYSNITRASWTTYDVMIGAAANDVTAGVLIKSA